MLRCNRNSRLQENIFIQKDILYVNWKAVHPGFFNKRKLFAYHLEDLCVPVVLRVPQVGKPCWGIVVVHYPGACIFWIHILIKNVRNLCLHHFSWFSETNGIEPELFYKNVPESIYIGCSGTILNRVTWCVANLGNLSKLNLSMQFWGRNLFAQIWPPDMKRVFQHHDLIYKKKTDLTSAWRFLRTKNIPSRNHFWAVPCIKLVWYVCFAVQI